jgi:hypothetical protein
MSSSTEVTPEKQQQNVEKVEAGAASTDAVQPEDTTAEKQKILAPIPSVNVCEEAAPIAAEKPEQPAQEGK